MNQILTLLFCFFMLSCQFKREKEQNEKINENGTLTKTEDSHTVGSADTLLNSNEYLLLGKRPAKVKVVKDNETDHFPTYNILITYKDGVIMGENIALEEVEVYKKYSPKTTFEDYKVDMYEGALADPDFSTAPAAKAFISRITNECKKGINFAGHYTLIIWGCGTACQSGVIVDRKTGRIFEEYGSSLGSEFRKDSKMLIKNIGAIDTTTNLIEVCAHCEVSHHVWTGTEFKEIE
ncbi:hypothetical protein [Arenibacter nanhaiticus]|nr:hypothetical protein [Arenibacter nanhaiticus]